jgi:hypothetical protein
LFRRTPKQLTLLEETINTALRSLDPNDDDYLKQVTAVETLYKLKDIDRKERVSADTMAIVAGNLAGILIIVSHERAHVVATKALSLLKKL